MQHQKKSSAPAVVDTRQIGVGLLQTQQARSDAVSRRTYRFESLAAEDGAGLGVAIGGLLMTGADGSELTRGDWSGRGGGGLSMIASRVI